MGSGTYSNASYAKIATHRRYDSASADELFASEVDVKNITPSYNVSARKYNKDIKPEMVSVGVRECRDSEEHPETTPIIIALDVTGSMGRIPHDLVKNQLPKIMNNIKEIGVKDPQILFMAIGDHEWDRYPIQAGQFESDTQKIADSLQSLYLEGGGGGNNGESYSLAHLIAGYHTEIDSWYKRHKKGFLFTIGDEPNLKTISKEFLVNGLKYQKGVEDMSSAELISKAKEQYEVFHIHVTDGNYRTEEVKSSWIELLGKNFLTCDSKDISKTISQKIKEYNSSKTVESPAKTEESVNKSDKKKFY